MHVLRKSVRVRKLLLALVSFPDHMSVPRIVWQKSYSTFHSLRRGSWHPIRSHYENASIPLPVPDYNLTVSPLSLLFRSSQSSQKWFGLSPVARESGYVKQGTLRCHHNLAAPMFTSLISRPHFSRPPEKWVWSTAYSIFVQVRRNVGALFFSNLTLDVIDDCIPHCVRMIYYRNGR